MSCNETRRLLDAYVDGELDVVHSIEFEEHLHECPACTQALEGQRSLSRALRTGGLRYRAPLGLEERVRAALAADAGAADAAPAAERPQPARGAVRRLPWNWIAAAVGAAAVFLLAWQFLALRARPSAEQVLADQVVSSHLRSLMLDHLTDVASTDQHTVKPWFAGKLDYSPPVQDFAAQGFPLAGGRLDSLQARPVAALVYRRRQHVINLFVWPTAAGANTESSPEERAEVRRGYNLIYWTQGGMAYWAVSDLNAMELREFVRLVRGRAP